MARRQGRSLPEVLTPGNAARAILILLCILPVPALGQVAADPDAVTARAYDRGLDQLGTLGSGNHFVEVCRVAEVYDEETAREFLLHYAGGGTDHPFDVLRAHAEERGDAIRVIISDWDFLGNVGATGALDALAFGVERSRVLVAFLALGGTSARARKTLAPVLDQPKFRLAVVNSLADFGHAAAALADALLGR